jgi:ribosomal protein S18 acetylase RimI-like enzyme
VLVVRDATRADAEAVSSIGRVSMPVQFEGLVDAVVVDAVATQTYEPAAVAECISHCTDADDAVFLVGEIDGAVVGYLHYDSFGEEPELHRIYIDQRFRSQGVGAALIEALHARLQPDTYILLVVKGNDGAIRFYERQGLTEEDVLDGIAHYKAAGVSFPAKPQPFKLVVMRYRRRRVQPRPERVCTRSTPTTQARSNQRRSGP